MIYLVLARAIDNRIGWFIAESSVILDSQINISIDLSVGFKEFRIGFS
jgi:hypothetical protein